MKGRMIIMIGIKPNMSKNSGKAVNRKGVGKSKKELIERMPKLINSDMWTQIDGLLTFSMVYDTSYLEWVINYLKQGGEIDPLVELNVLQHTIDCTSSIKQMNEILKNGHGQLVVKNLNFSKTVNIEKKDVEVHLL